jgi:hypothetical protein
VSQALIDAVWLIAACVVVGGLAGVVMIWGRRKRLALVQVNQRARDLLDIVGQSRNPKIEVVENATAARALGYEWHDSADWPSDQEGMQLMCVATRVARVEESLHEFARTRRAADRHLRPSEKKTYQKAEELAEHFVMTGHACTERGEIDDGQREVLFASSDDPIAREIDELQMALTHARVPYLARPWIGST